MAKTAILATILILITCNVCNAQKYMLLDSRFRKPLGSSENFSDTDIFSQRFPVYREDVPQIVSQAVALAKSIERKSISEEYIDTLLAGHSMFIAKAERIDGKISITVYLKTMLIYMSVIIDLVEKKEGKREAQVKLLNFTQYLNTN